MLDLIENKDFIFLKNDFNNIVEVDFTKNEINFFYSLLSFISDKDLTDFEIDIFSLLKKAHLHNRVRFTEKQIDFTKRTLKKIQTNLYDLELESNIKLFNKIGFNKRTKTVKGYINKEIFSKYLKTGSNTQYFKIRTHQINIISTVPGKRLYRQLEQWDGIIRPYITINNLIDRLHFEKVDSINKYSSSLYLNGYLNRVLKNIIDSGVYFSLYTYRKDEMITRNTKIVFDAIRHTTEELNTKYNSIIKEKYENNTVIELYNDDYTIALSREEIQANNKVITYNKSTVLEPEIIEEPEVIISEIEEPIIAEIINNQETKKVDQLGEDWLDNLVSKFTEKNKEFTVSEEDNHVRFKQLENITWIVNNKNKYVPSKLARNVDENIKATTINTESFNNLGTKTLLNNDLMFVKTNIKNNKLLGNTNYGANLTSIMPVAFKESNEYRKLNDYDFDMIIDLVENLTPESKDEDWSKYKDLIRNYYLGSYYIFLEHLYSIDNKNALNVKQFQNVELTEKLLRLPILYSSIHTMFNHLYECYKDTVLSDLTLDGFYQQARFSIMLYLSTLRNFGNVGTFIFDHEIDNCNNVAPVLSSLKPEEKIDLELLFSTLDDNNNEYEDLLYE